MNKNLNIIKPGQTGSGILIEHDGYINSKDNQEFIKEMNKIESGERVIAEPLMVTVVLQKYGVKNKNGRIYPKNILEREAKNYQVLIDQNNALGELNHPDTSELDADRLSHMITKIWWEKKTLMGEMEIIMSPGFVKSGIISCVGDKVANYIRKGVLIGVSSRGVGTLKQINGENIVQDDFELICWDVVVTPSTPGSWMSTRSEDLQQFVESEDKDNKSDDFLLDFLN
jgi:hypothetical protein